MRAYETQSSGDVEVLPEHAAASIEQPLGNRGASPLDSALVRTTLARAVVSAILVAFCSVAVRVVVLRVLPEGSWSVDMDTWLRIAQIMQSGANPYNVTDSVNWPPMWTQILFLLSHISAFTGLRLVRVIQLFLILVEAVLTAITYLLLSRHWPTRRAFLIVLIGLVLNPVAILLTTVHGNFDVIVGLLVLLFVWAVTSYHRDGRHEDWLLACLFLGLGILTKTTPLVLLPLLSVGVRHLNVREIVTGAFLVAAPVVLGLSVIFMLGPHQVLDHVIRYRSAGGLFGITGLFNLFHWPYPRWFGYSPPGAPLYTAVFGLVMLSAGCMVIYLGTLRQKTLHEYHLVLIAAGLLVAVPVLGPGYATQYAWWWIALLVLVFALGGQAARIVCITMLVVTSVTYIIEYALVDALGAVLLRWPHPAWFHQLDLASYQPTNDTIFRVPEFVAYLAFLFLAAWTVARRVSRGEGTRTGTDYPPRADVDRVEGAPGSPGARIAHR